MKVLIVKTSSLGDVLHTLPAITDAVKQLGTIQFHWLVEESLAEIPSWHPAVTRVIPFPWRRWRHHPLAALGRGEPIRFLQELRHHTYDAIIDAQGLLKSAIPARLAKGKVWGHDRHSAREPWASWWYHHPVKIATGQHAIDRVRQLFAQVLGYPPPTTPPDYGLAGPWMADRERSDHLVFIHGTTWPSKHWPQDHWQQLAASLDGTYPIRLPWGNAIEKKRAEAIAAAAPLSAQVLEKTTLEQLAGVLATARLVVAVDTGPAHLAAALATPALCLYGPTDPALVGTVSGNHDHDCGPCPRAPCRHKICPLINRDAAPPCMAAITPTMVQEWLERKE